MMSQSDHLHDRGTNHLLHDIRQLPSLNDCEILRPVRKPARHLQPEDLPRWIGQATRALKASRVDRSDGEEQAVRDCITALLHYANTQGIEIGDMLDHALIAFLEETEA